MPSASPIAAAGLSERLAALVTSWHEADPAPGETGLAGLIVELHRFNFLIWHEEADALPPPLRSPFRAARGPHPKRGVRFRAAEPPRGRTRRDSAPTPKKRHSGAKAGVPGGADSAPGNGARGSSTAHRLENGCGRSCGRVIDQVILRPSVFDTLAYRHHPLPLVRSGTRETSLTPIER
jgi:hypothetical protein